MRIPKRRTSSVIGEATASIPTKFVFDGENQVVDCALPTFALLLVAWKGLRKQVRVCSAWWRRQRAPGRWSELGTDHTTVNCWSSSCIQYYQRHSNRVDLAVDTAPVPRSIDFIGSFRLWERLGRLHTRSPPRYKIHMSTFIYVLNVSLNMTINV